LISRRARRDRRERRVFFYPIERGTAWIKGASLRTKPCTRRWAGSDQAKGLKIFAKVKNKDRLKGLEGHFGYRKSEFKRIYLRTQEMGTDLFSKTLMHLNFKKGLDRTALAKVKQDYPHACTKNVCDHVHELGASCWKVNLDQFNRKAYATCKKGMGVRSRNATIHKD